MRSKVYEKFGSMEPSDVKRDLKSFTSGYEGTLDWSCHPIWVDEEIIEEDDFFWVNYHCDTAGQHSFGPYGTKEEAESMKEHLKNVVNRRRF